MTHPIIQKVNEYFGVDILEAPVTRKREICFPRMTAMYLTYLFTKKSMKEIALDFKRNDHTCILQARKVIWDLCKTNPDIKAQIIELESLFE